MNGTRSEIITALFAWIPYLLASWGYSVISNDSFWSVFGVLIALRIFFSIIETLGGILAWRLYRRKKVIEIYLNTLRANNFPKRHYYHDGFLDYLSRIENDESSPQHLKLEAKLWEQTFEISENFSALTSMRMRDAANEALNIYSPKHAAPLFEYGS